MNGMTNEGELAKTLQPAVVKVGDPKPRTKHAI